MAASKPLLFTYCDKEYQFTDKDKQSIEKFLCVICLQLLFDPVQTSCGHLFCEECFQRCKKTTCPTCKTTFTRPAVNDNFNKREVKNLTVLCPNASRGCEWKGELGSVEAHEEDDCAYQLVQCPNKCGTEVERRELETHQKDHCELRRYACPYCESSPFFYHVDSAIGTYKYITTEHFKTCVCYPVDCPNTCAVKGLVRRDLSSHLAVCPDEVIPCRYQALGCKVRLARKEVSNHLEDKDSHLVLAMRTTLDQAHQLSQHKSVLSQHKSAIDSQQQQITSLQQQMSLLLRKIGVKLPPAPPHPAKPWLKVDPLPLRYPPFTIKMDTSGADDSVDSPPFQSHPGGYRLTMRKQCGSSIKEMIDVVAIDCPENHFLKWPVTFTVECVFLNQNEDKDHNKDSMQLTLRHPKDACRLCERGVFRRPYTYTYIPPQPDKSTYYIKVLSVAVIE